MSNAPYRKQNPSSIREMFSSIAPQYDSGNAVLSFQFHRLWNRQLVEKVIRPQRPETLLDLCCGTGEIAFSYLKSLRQQGVKPCDVTLIDFSEGMLEEARKKAVRHNLDGPHMRFVVADAQLLPLPNESVDTVVIAYGIRNVAEPARCLDEVYRVLRPGGQLGILELTRPTNRLMALGHAAYLRMAVPLLGRLITSNYEAYRYLCDSVNTFISPDELQHAIRMTGYANSWRKPLMGGIATLFCGQKRAHPTTSPRNTLLHHD